VVVCDIDDEIQQYAVMAAEEWSAAAEPGSRWLDRRIPYGDPAVRGAALRGLHARGLTVEPLADGAGWLVVEGTP
jgi:hypothetical protein